MCSRCARRRRRVRAGGSDAAACARRRAGGNSLPTGELCGPAQGLRCAAGRRRPCARSRTATRACALSSARPERGRSGGGQRLPAGTGGDRSGRGELGHAARAGHRAESAGGTGHRRARVRRRATCRPPTRTAHRDDRRGLAGLRLVVPDRGRPRQHRLWDAAVEARRAARQQRRTGRPARHPRPDASGPARPSRDATRPPPAPVDLAAPPARRCGPACRGRRVADQSAHR